MDNIYAIYTYKFVQKNDEGDWTQSEQAQKADMTHAQDSFFQLFGKKNTVFHVQKNVGDGAKKYDCKVYGNDHRIVALRLLNSFEKSYYQEEADAHDPMGKIRRRSVTSTPDTYVIIDCRPGHNILGVKVEKDAWRNTDTVRDLMEASINFQLERLSLGFRVQLLTKMIDHEFFNYSRQRIIEDKRMVKKMTIYFTSGKLNPTMAAVVKGNTYLRQLFSVIDKYSLSGEMTLNQPIGQKLIDRRRHDIEDIITLVASDPSGYAMAMTFDDNVTLHCGKDVRAELPMKPAGALELFHSGWKKEQQTKINFDNPEEVDDGTYLLEGWLDNVAEETKKMRDAETVKPKRGRANRKQAS